MFDIAASEVLVVIIVAILVIGPKDMPAALRAAGRWIGKIRRVSGHFRSGLDTMIREAEMEDMFCDTGMGKEWGGPMRGGRMPEPTRFGDWERKGRCTDF